MNVRSVLLVFGCVIWNGVVGCGPPEPQAPEPKAPPAAEPAPAIEEKTEPQAAVESGAEVERDAKPQAAVVEPPARRRDDAVEPAQLEEPVTPGDPQRRTTFYRLDASGPAKIPPVVLSKSHEALCKVKVGDMMPAIELPPVGSNQVKKLAELYGESATVVVFWKGDRRMAREELADLGPDVLDVFGKQGVAVVGVAVNETAASAKAALDKLGAGYPNLLDADGRAFAQVGSAKLPRTYLVDPQGKILWFDIEYSPSTRRELHRALYAVTGAPPESPVPAAAQE